MQPRYSLAMAAQRRGSLSCTRRIETSTSPDQRTRPRTAKRQRRSREGDASESLHSRPVVAVEFEDLAGVMSGVAVYQLDLAIGVLDHVDARAGHYRAIRREPGD